MRRSTSSAVVMAALAKIRRMALQNPINSAAMIAITTFLWYRKGRLWNFYDELLSKCIDQIQRNSIDRERWEQIALEQCDYLSKQTFQSLFRFEVEYLRQAIKDRQYAFWIADSETTLNEQVVYTDKEKFCRYRLRQLFYPDLRFCGLGLFLRALYWQITKKEEDKGYMRKKL